MYITAALLLAAATFGAAFEVSALNVQVPMNGQASLTELNPTSTSYLKSLFTQIQASSRTGKLPGIFDGFCNTCGCLGAQCQMRFLTTAAERSDAQMQHTLPAQTATSTLDPSAQVSGITKTSNVQATTPVQDHPGQPASSSSNTGDVAVHATVTSAASFSWGSFPSTFKGPDSRTTIYRQDVEGPGSQENGKPNDVSGDDATDLYYTPRLEGYHPNSIPIIVTSKNDPITVLAHANTSHTFNLMSYGLLAALDRTQDIIVAPSLQSSENITSSPNTNDAEITKIIGRQVHVLGMVSLDVIAGRDDKQFSSVPFHIFRLQANNQSDFTLIDDVELGLHFLNRAAALQLSDEYVGPAAGAKDGVPVLVQRIRTPNASSAAAALDGSDARDMAGSKPHHDEL